MYSVLMKRNRNMKIYIGVYKVYKCTRVHVGFLYI